MEHSSPRLFILSDKIESVQKRASGIVYPGLHNSEAIAISGCIRLSLGDREFALRTFAKFSSHTLALSILSRQPELVFTAVRSDKQPAMLIQLQHCDAHGL